VYQQAIPAWKRNFLMLAVSSILLVCGALIGIVALNLLPIMDHIHGEMRLFVSLVAAGCFGIGGAFSVAAVTDKETWIFWSFFAPGTICFVGSMSYLLYLIHSSSPNPIW
jgi:peptidoglycan/LPS O-acetylase OafA/YrhL